MTIGRFTFQYPGTYCSKALIIFENKMHTLNKQPRKNSILVYGHTIQHAKEEDTPDKLDKEKTEFVQHVTGTFVYYTKSVNATTMIALCTIAADNTAQTNRTMDKTLYFLDYAASHPDAMLSHRASDMFLAVHSGSSYLTEHNIGSRAGGHFLYKRMFNFNKTMVQ